MAIAGLDQREMTLGGEQIYIQQMPTDKGLELACRLAKLVGGAAQGLGEVHPAQANGKARELDVDINIGKIVDGFASRMDHREVPQLLKELVRQSMVRPEFSDDWYNVRFSGRYEQLLELVGIILEHNYGPAMEILKKNTAHRLGPYVFSWQPEWGINPLILRPVQQHWVSYVEAKQLSLTELIRLNLEIDRMIEAAEREAGEERDR